MSLEKIREEYLKLVKEVKDEKELYDLRVKFLGKKGALTDIMKGARDLSPEERPSFGKLVNEVKTFINNSLEEKRAELAKAALELKLASEEIDVTLPSRKVSLGGVNPLNKIIEEIEEYIKVKNVEKENLSEKYNYPLDERYNYILNKILDEEKLFISEKDNNFIINGDSEAIKDLEIFKNMNFKEIDFYLFYVNYLSKKEYENKKVIVGYNGVDGKEITMLKLKEDINKIRDSRSTFKN